MLETLDVVFTPKPLEEAAVLPCEEYKHNEIRCLDVCKIIALNCK